MYRYAKMFYNTIFRYSQNITTLPTDFILIKMFCIGDFLLLIFYVSFLLPTKRVISIHLIIMIEFYKM